MEEMINCCLTWRPPRAVILSKAAGRAEGSPSASPNHDHKRTFVYREILRLGLALCAALAQDDYFKVGRNYTKQQFTAILPIG